MTKTSKIQVYLNGGPANGYTDQLTVPNDEDGQPILPDELDVDDIDDRGKQIGRLLYSERKALPYAPDSYTYSFEAHLDNS